MFGERARLWSHGMYPWQQPIELVLVCSQSVGTVVESKMPESDKRGIKNDQVMKIITNAPHQHYLFVV